MQFRHLVPYLVGSALTLAGCQDYYFETIKLETIKEQTISVPAAKPIPADIIFVVDNSCSMEDEQELLAKNFESFIREIVGKGDYRIGIISTDTLNGSIGYEKIGTREPDFSNTSPFLLKGYINKDETDPTRCLPLDGNDNRELLRHGCFRKAADSDIRVIDSKLAPEKQRDAFEKNVALGSCATGDESGLESLRLALANTSTSGCNQGFLRPEANLVLIFVSDENDHGSSGNASDYVELLKQYKPIEKVRVGAIVGVNSDGEPRNCRIDDTAGITTDSCGGLCLMRPPEGSLVPCTVREDCPSPSTEECVEISNTSTQTVCRNLALKYFDDQDDRSDKWCNWCSFYPVEDCCSAMRGDEYVEFARAVERAVTAVDGNIMKTNCRRMPGERVACLVDSVCQENFSDTLKAIARDLVATDKYTLDPPACNPDGVVVVVGAKKSITPNTNSVQTALNSSSPG